MKFLQHELAYRLATQRQLSRREALFKMGAGIGGIGLASMFGSNTVAAEQASPLAPKLPHFAPKAKRLIQLFMPGGPSQVDTFDYKPMLAKHKGERPALVDRKTLRNTKMGRSLNGMAKTVAVVEDIANTVVKLVDFNVPLLDKQ